MRRPATNQGKNVARRPHNMLPFDDAPARPINDVCAISAFHRIATKLLHYGK